MLGVVAEHLAGYGEYHCQRTADASPDPCNEAEDEGGGAGEEGGV